MMNNKQVVELPIEDVLPNRFQPRIKFKEDSISELAESIKEHGVIQPIVVRRIGDKYEIIAGERRYKATTTTGLKTIPAIITDLNDKESAEVALIENVQRENLTPIEEAISYKKILDMGYLTQDQLATKLGKKQSTIANKLRLLNLDEDVQEALLDNKISERHARSLLRITSEAEQKNMLQKIINERLTVRATDEEIKKMFNNNVNNSTNFFTPNNVQPNPTEPSMNPINDEINPVEIPFNEPQPSQFSMPQYADQDLEKTQSLDFSTLQSSKNIEDEKELQPAKFFNILDEDNNQSNFVTPSPQPSINNDDKSLFKFDDLFSTDNNSAEPIDFNSFTNPKEDEIKEDTEPFDFSSFGFPNINNEQSSIVEQPLSMPTTGAVTDMRPIINTIRECASTIEKFGFVIDIDEYDLSDIYQVTFKVHKK